MVEPTPLDQVRAIERRRFRANLKAGWLTAGVVLLLVGSFMGGYGLGPAPFRPVEVVVGASLLALVAAVLVFLGPIARGRHIRGARGVWALREGRLERKVVLFDDHLCIGAEIVLRSTMQRVEREGDRLVLRYQDPVAAGPLLRELTGSPAVLEEITAALRQAPGAAGSVNRP